jgi:hypothetical protein
MARESLWAAYLERHFRPAPGEEPAMVSLSAADCSPLIFAWMQDIGVRIGPEAIDRQPTRAAIRELDEVLRKIVISGSLVALLRLRPAAMRELYARLEWCLMGLMLEEGAGSTWSMPMPADAPPDVREAALLLDLLSGPGKDYPPRQPRGKPASTVPFPRHSLKSRQKTIGCS